MRDLCVHIYCNGESAGAAILAGAGGRRRRSTSASVEIYSRNCEYGSARMLPRIMVCMYHAYAGSAETFTARYAFIFYSGIFISTLAACSYFMPRDFNRVPRGNLTRSLNEYLDGDPAGICGSRLRIKLIHRPRAQIYSTVNPVSRTKLSSFCCIKIPCSIRQFAIFENKAQTPTYNTAGISVHSNERDR